MTLSKKTLRKTVSCNDVYSLLNLYGFDFDLLVPSLLRMSMFWSYPFKFTQC